MLLGQRSHAKCKQADNFLANENDFLFEIYRFKRETMLKDKTSDQCLLSPLSTSPFVVFFLRNPSHHYHYHHRHRRHRHDYYYDRYHLHHPEANYL